MRLKLTYLCSCHHKELSIILTLLKPAKKSTRATRYLVMQPRGQVIELSPTNVQATHLAKACGTARFAYNWALAQWENQYREDKRYLDYCAQTGITVTPELLNKPNEAKLRKQLNAIKHTDYTWMSEVSKSVCQMAIRQLGDAFARFFKGLSDYPVFRNKGKDDRFTLYNELFDVKGNQIKLAKLGWVKMTESLRWSGKLLSAKVFKKGRKWFVSISMDIQDPLPIHAKTGKTVGVDLGIANLATLSDGKVFPALRPYKTKQKQLKRLQRRLSKKKKGSKNRAKAKTKLGTLHRKIAQIRKNAIHQLTNYLVKHYDVIGIEDLNTQGMLKNRRLAKAIADMGFYEFKRQLNYKAHHSNKTVVLVDRFYPSSKTCSCCDHVMSKEEMTLNVRQWQCPNCYSHHDRDMNAAINLRNQALREVA